jgi:hypothetical protein
MTFRNRNIISVCSYCSDGSTFGTFVRFRARVRSIRSFDFASTVGAKSFHEITKKDKINNRSVAGAILPGPKIATQRPASRACLNVLLSESYLLTY